MAIKIPSEALEQRVLQFILQNRLVKAGQKVLVAVSGGPDSVCLLQVLLKIQTELHITLHIAHLNHQLRGAESDSDAEYVARLAAKLDLPAAIEKRNVYAYQAEHRLSLEEAAREVRYAFLAQTARQVGADRVTVGHTLNDQVETILLHIIRGTGTRGLRGLQPVQTLQFAGNHLTVIRPLLEVRRQETEDYCSSLHLVPCRDSSNLSPSALRNRVRHNLLPLLQSFNPDICAALLRTGRIAGDDLAFLETAALQVRPEVLHREKDSFIIDKSAFRALAPALQRHLLRNSIHALLGTLKDIETRHIEEILEALELPAGRSISLPEGLIFSIEYNRCMLGFHPQELAPFPELTGNFDLQVPGQTEIPGWRIESAVIPSASFSNAESGYPWNNDSFTAFFDLDKVGVTIKVRARRPGDRFQPLGLDSLKKVGEFMLDAHIPQTWRNRIPVVYNQRQIIWIAGWRIDDRVRVTPETRSMLCLKMVRYTYEQPPGSGKDR